MTLTQVKVSAFRFDEESKEAAKEVQPMKTSPQSKGQRAKTI